MTLRPYLIGAAGGAAIALLVGWILWHPEPVHETAAPAKQLPSGGQVFERKPDAPVPAATKKAAKEAGGKLERSISVTVQPRSIQAPAVAGQLAASPSHEGAVPAAAAPGHAPDAGKMVCSCAPVTVDLGLVRMPDRTRRVVATSPDGDVIAGMDIPLDSPAVSKPLRWAAGVSVSIDETRRRGYGAFVDRDLGPLRLGVEVQQRRDGVAAVLRAGIRF